MKNFKEYYLIKAFPEQNYRDQFNSGEKLYINSVEYFHKHGDEFQRDFEGGVFQQSELGKGMFIFSKQKYSFEQIVDKYKNNHFEDSDFVIPTKGFKVFIQGYISCFSIIPKDLINIHSNQIVFADLSIQKEFYDFLNGYAKEKGYTFFSIYDAAKVIPLFCRGMEKNGFSVCYGDVQYKKISTEDRIRDFQSRNIQNIVFAKDNSYAYQKEFRFFIQTKGEYTDHIEIEGIDFQESVICSLAYLTNEFVQKNHITIGK